MCPANYELNGDKTACIPTILTCEDGFVLNDSGDKCIPDGTGIVPFPFLFLAVCLCLIVIASKIKDRLNSRWIANFLALFGIIEPALIITLFVSCIAISRYVATIITAVALICHYILNLSMLIYFKKVTLKDAEFSRWVKVYRKTKIALACLGTIFSFRMYKLFYSGIFGIDSCLARFDKPDRALMKIQKWLGFVSLAVVYATLVAAAIVVFYNVKWGYQALVEAIEVLIFAVVFLILHILERRYDTNPCSDQEYIQIGMKKYGDDVTMAGVPLNYGDSIREREEERDVALRKQALASIIASVSTYSKNGLFSNENLDTCRVKPSMRRAFSYKHLPVIQEEEGESSDEEADYYYKPRRKRRFSIGTEKHLEQYADKKFFSAIDDIRSGKYLPNNVYADSHPEREIPEEARLLNVERATQTDDNDLKLLWRLSRTIPPFKLADILGEFEMDPSGMFIIIRDGGKLKDKHGRLVNTRGYLVDEEGNVIHQNGKSLRC